MSLLFLVSVVTILITPQAEFPVENAYLNDMKYAMKKNLEIINFKRIAINLN